MDMNGNSPIMINDTSVDLEHVFSKQNGMVSVTKSTVVPSFAGSVEFSFSDKTTFAFSCAMHDLPDRDEIGLMRLYLPSGKHFIDPSFRHEYQHIVKVDGLTVRNGKTVFLCGISILFSDQHQFDFASAYTPLHLGVHFDGEVIFGGIDIGSYERKTIWSSSFSG